MLDWVTYDRVLADFSPGDTAARRRRHRRNVMAGLNQSIKSPSANAVHGLIVGSQKFALGIQRLLYVRPADPAVRKLQRLREKPELAEIVKTGLCEFNEDMPWSVGCRANDTSRAITAYLARRRYGYSAKAVANALGYGYPSSVSHVIRRVESGSATLRQTAKRLEQRFKRD